jgi:hypothetical protein
LFLFDIVRGLRHQPPYHPAAEAPHSRYRKRRRSNRMKPSVKRLLVCLVVPPVTGSTLGHAATSLYLNVIDPESPLPSHHFSIPAFVVATLLLFAITLLPSLLLALLYERYLFDASRGNGAPLPVFAVTVPFGALLGLLLVVLMRSAHMPVFTVMMMATGGVMGAMTAWGALAVSRGKRSEKSANKHSSSEPTHKR